MSYTIDDARFDAEQLGKCPICLQQDCRHCSVCGALRDKLDDLCPNCDDDSDEYDPLTVGLLESTADSQDF